MVLWVKGLITISKGGPLQIQGASDDTVIIFGINRLYRRQVSQLRYQAAQYIRKFHKIEHLPIRRDWYQTSGAHIRSLWQCWPEGRTELFSLASRNQTAQRYGCSLRRQADEFTNWASIAKINKEHVYGVWGDENGGDGPPLVGEASIGLEAYMPPAVGPIVDMFSNWRTVSQSVHKLWFIPRVKKYHVIGSKGFCLGSAMLIPIRGIW